MSATISIPWEVPDLNMTYRTKTLLLFLSLIGNSVYSLSCQAGWNEVVDLTEKIDLPGKQAAKAISDSGLNNDEVIAGLKEALVKGSRTAVNTLGKENGFFSHPRLKIPMPEKLQVVESALRKLEQDKIADEFVLSMNRAAEKATPEAMSVLTNATKSMSIKDAYGILKGPDNAATEYLEKTSGSDLQKQFLPIVKQATGNVGVTEKYKALIDKLGDNLGPMAGFTDTTSLDIDKYVTDKAMAGLFSLVASEEKLIRDNPAARTTDLLKKVFSGN